MLKPFILDPCSTIYKKQFKCCKLYQALLGTQSSSHDYMQSQSRPADNSKNPSDTHRIQAASVPSSPRYSPYPKLPSPAQLDPNSFRPYQDSSSPCLHCGKKGHHMPDCSAKHSSRPECSIIVVWAHNRLKTIYGKHICLMFNIRGSCSSGITDKHGAHSCSLCGNPHHRAKDCSQN